MKIHYLLLFIILGCLATTTVSAKRYEIKTAHKSFVNLYNILKEYDDDLDDLKSEIYELTEDAYQKSREVDNDMQLGVRDKHKIHLREKVYWYQKNIKKFQDYLLENTKYFNGELDVNDLVKSYDKIRKYQAGTEKYIKWSKVEISEPGLIEKILEDLSKLQKELKPYIDLQEEYKLYGRPAKKKAIKFKSAQHACYSLAAPGNIILKKALLLEGSTDDDFNSRTMFWIKLKEALSFHDLSLSYRHSELITQMKHYSNIETISYYPKIFDMKREEGEKIGPYILLNNKHDQYSFYRMNYSVFRVEANNEKGELKKREKALDKVLRKDKYSELGVCSDFTNWLYDDQITSNWNFIPIVKQLIQLVYIPEGIQTPDNIADSYMTEMVCDIKHHQLTYPERIDLHAWSSRLKTDLTSSNENIKDHAEKILKDLKRQSLIDSDNNPTVDMAEIEIRKWNF